MSKVVHLSDHAHNKAKAYCQTRGLKMSEWVASLIDRATDDKLDMGPLASSQMASTAMGDMPAHAEAHTTGTLRASDVATDVAPYQALVQKKKLTSAVAGVQNLPDSATPIYEAPPFWAR